MATPQETAGLIADLKRCSRCGEWKPYSDYTRCRTYRDGYRAGCRPCISAAQREYYQRTRTQRLDYDRYSTYGLSAEAFAAMLDAQGNRCAICGKPETLTYGGRLRDLCVDHNHTTDRVRALLCHGCNAGLGLFREDPEALEAAAAYIRRFNDAD